MGEILDRVEALEDWRNRFVPAVESVLNTQDHEVQKLRWMLLHYKKAKKKVSNIFSKDTKHKLIAIEIQKELDRGLGVNEVKRLLCDKRRLCSRGLFFQILKELRAGLLTKVTGKEENTPKTVT